jgi:hypothetical protein
MTLNEGREGLPFQLISRHVKSHQDENVTLPTSPGPNNSTYSLIAALQPHLMNFVPLIKPKSCTHYPPVEAIFVTQAAISPVANNARLEPNFLSSSFERIVKNATIGPTTPMFHQLAGLRISQCWTH